MTPLLRERAKNLRRSAVHCRELAQGALPFEVVQELESFADCLEAEAAKLERAETAPHRSTPHEKRGRAAVGAATPSRKTARSCA